ncbi:MAG TPA: hypothetical protein VFN35_15140, partial [Ktedonobacteraceae bacterium]|nr:hypothetical protein [Ktedonobacteraceae bacterium]
ARREELREQYGIEWRLTGIATRRMGWIAQPDGLDASELLNGQLPPGQANPPHDVQAWLRAAQADVVFELTSTNPQTGQPAIDYLRASLEHGAHIITANKGVVVHGYQELHQLAQKQGKQFFFEATVMAGAPLFSLFQQNLPLMRIERVRGLFNSTSNVIIAEMEQGKSFAEAIALSQELGIAETDPGLDIDGWDAAVKICILANVLLHIPLSLQEVQVEGIRHLTPEMVQEAKRLGTPYKMVAALERRGEDGKQLQAWVRPEKLALSDTLASVSPASLLTHFDMDIVSGLTVILHAQATGTEVPDGTAYDVLTDFIRAVRS